MEEVSIASLVGSAVRWGSGRNPDSGLSGLTFDPRFEHSQIVKPQSQDFGFLTSAIVADRRSHIPATEAPRAQIGRLRIEASMRPPAELTADSIRQMLPTTQARLDPAAFSQRANTALGVATRDGAATLLVIRRGSEINSFVITPPGTSAHQAGFQIAQAVGARSAEVEPAQMPDIADTSVACMRAEDGPVVARYAQVGVDFLELPRIAANNLGDGDWIAVTVRKKTSREAARWRAWMNFNAGNTAGSHHSMEANAVVYSIMAGSPHGPDAAEANLTAIVSGMPGFDIQARSVKLSDSTGRLRAGAAAALSIAALIAVMAGAGSSLPAPLAAAADWTAVRIAIAFIAAVAVGVCALRLAGKLPPSSLRELMAIDRLVFPTPRKRHGRVRPPRREKIDQRSGRVQPEFAGDYPLAARCFLGAPSVFTSLVAPASGARSGHAESSARPVPPVLSQRIGPLFGTDPADGSPVHLDVNQLRFGTAILGQAGAGKSVFIRQMFAYNLLDKLNPSNLPGAPGANSTNIAIENKGPDGAAHYVEWAKALGADVELLELSDPATPAIDLFASGAADDHGRARDFVDAMIYAWSDTEIGNRAKDVLIRTLHAGLVIADEPDIVADANAGLDDFEDPVPAGASAIVYAQILCGGGSGGDDMGKRLAAALRAAADEMRAGTVTADSRIIDASNGLGQLYIGRSERDRRSLVESSLNKLDRLAGLESWFSPSRPKRTWQEILESHSDVILNLGMSTSRQAVSEHETAIMSAIVMHTMQQAIARTCVGWADANRWVSVYADELSLLCGSSPEVVVWMRDQGRAFGVRPIWGTQRPGQLPRPVRESLLSMETLIALAQSNAGVIAEIVEDLALDGTEWKAEDIAALPKYSAAVRTRAGGNRLPGFIIITVYFEDDRSGFAAAQGY